MDFNIIFLNDEGKKSTQKKGNKKSGKNQSSVKP